MLFWKRANKKCTFYVSMLSVNLIWKKCFMKLFERIWALNISFWNHRKCNRMKNIALWRNIMNHRFQLPNRQKKNRCQFTIFGLCALRHTHTAREREKERSDTFQKENKWISSSEFSSIPWWKIPIRFNFSFWHSIIPMIIFTFSSSAIRFWIINIYWDICVMPFDVLVLFFFASKSYFNHFGNLFPLSIAHMNIFYIKIMFDMMEKSRWKKIRSLSFLSFSLYLACSNPYMRYELS